MAALGSFESNPHVAAACSGGADSMALAVLLDGWTRARGGRLTALTVDHRLRPESAAEAAQVAAWLGARSIPHVILTREGGPLTGNLQAAARQARYALLTGWCAANGVLHLALAHHREDQAETLLLRLARGSGVDGLSAMAAVAETAEVRLLRPLLDVSRARLAATLDAAGQAHVEDPSNANEAFGRVRLRQAAGVLAREGLTVARLAETAHRMARARAALEAGAADLLARSVALYPEGYAILRPEPLRRAPAETALRALARLIATVAGTPYPPRFERLERLWQALCDDEDGGRTRTGRTLGGCRILPHRAGWLICREPRAASEVAASPGAGVVHWDGRFRIRTAGRSRCEIRRLGQKGWSKLVAERPDLRSTAIPAAVRPSLPSFWYLDAVISVPHLKYVRRRADVALPSVEEVTFAPRKALTGAGFISGLSGSESLTLGTAL